MSLIAMRVFEKLLARESNQGTTDGSRGMDDGSRGMSKRDIHTGVEEEASSFRWHGTDSYPLHPWATHMPRSGQSGSSDYSSNELAAVRSTTTANLWL